MARLRIGSRGSQLALWQANHISKLLRDQGHVVELEIIKTTGDKILDVALAKVGTKGMFTKEIEEALVENRVDLAVHSLKDFPRNSQSNLRLRPSRSARIHGTLFSRGISNPLLLFPSVRGLAPAVFAARRS